MVTYVRGRSCHTILAGVGQKNLIVETVFITF